MKANLSIEWDHAPLEGRIEVVNGTLVHGSIHVGTGAYNDGRFSFSSTGQYADRPPVNDIGLCKLVVQIDTETVDDPARSATISIVDSPEPFSVKLAELPKDRPLPIEELGVEVVYQPDVWGDGGYQADDTTGYDAYGNRPLPEGLPRFERFTPEHIKQFGPMREPQRFRTERRVYETPFMYANVEVGDLSEIDPIKGIELIADTGFISVTEDKPILGVTVVGSSCKAKGYNICEWWDEGETIDNMTNQLVKRQRVDNLNGTHPQIYLQLLMGTFPGLTFNDVVPGQIKDAVDCLKKQSDGYYGGVHMGFYENTAYFRVGPPYPKTITVRGGCKAVEEPGLRGARYPGEYAFRLIETTVIV